MQPKLVVVDASKRLALEGLATVVVCEQLSVKRNAMQDLATPPAASIAIYGWSVGFCNAQMRMIDNLEASCSLVHKIHGRWER